MAEVVFLDSSILFNLLQVPHKCGDRDAVLAEFQKLRQAGATFVFPVAAVIETGNHIAHLDGQHCWECMNTFVTFLSRALQAAPPWAVSGVAWDQDFLQALVDGGNSRLALIDFATSNGIGGGDASLLLEIERYRAKVPSATPVRLWTLDRALGSYA